MDVPHLLKASEVCWVSHPHGNQQSFSQQSQSLFQSVTVNNALCYTTDGADMRSSGKRGSLSHSHSTNRQQPGRKIQTTKQLANLVLLYLFNLDINCLITHFMQVLSTFFNSHCIATACIRTHLHKEQMNFIRRCTYHQQL